MYISLPMPGYPGLMPTFDVTNLQTGQLLNVNIPMTETAPEIYTAEIELPVAPPIVVPSPTVTAPPIPKPQNIPIPVAVTVTTGLVEEDTAVIAVGSNVLTPYEIKPIIISQVEIVKDNATRCPYCFSKIGLVADPENFIWSEDPTLCVGSKVNPFYKGHQRIRAKHITELQDNRKKLEEDLGITPRTVFTPVDTLNFYQALCGYILELRSSTEKILANLGITKETYFNYNELGTEMRINHQLDWIDKVDLASQQLSKFQIKGLHIEDLRHNIGIFDCLYMFFISPELPYEDRTKWWVKKIIKKDTVDSSIKIINNNYPDWIQNGSVDNKYLYYYKSPFLRVVNKDTLSTVSNIFLGIGFVVYSAVKNDSTHVYVYIKAGSYARPSTFKIFKIQKAIPNSNPPITWKVVDSKNVVENWADFEIGKDYIYLSRLGIPAWYAPNYLLIRGIDTPVSLHVAHSRTLLVKKSNLSMVRLWVTYSGGTYSTYPDYFYIWKFRTGTFSTDNNHIYASLLKEYWQKEGDLGEEHYYHREELDVVFFGIHPLFDVGWTPLKILTADDWTRYKKLVMDERYVFGVYINLGIHYFIVWDKLSGYSEVLKTHTLIDNTDSENPIIVPIGASFNILTTTRQYKYATKVEE